MPFSLAITGGITLIDERDLDIEHTVEMSGNLVWIGRIPEHTWRVSRKQHTNYVTTNLVGSIELRLHRVILNAKRQQIVDHIDHSGLNNCRSNLRFVTATENSINRKPLAKFKGVALHKQTGKFEGYIKSNRHKKHLGLFLTEKDAALAYDAEARNLWGDMAVLNFASVAS